MPKKAKALDDWKVTVIVDDAALRRALKAAGRKVNELTPVNREIADRLTTIVKSRVPVDTGRLRKSVKRKATSKAAGVIYGGDGIRYHQVVEYGRQDRGEYTDRGRYVHPVIEEEKGWAVAKYEAFVAKIAATI